MDAGAAEDLEVGCRVGKGRCEDGRDVNVYAKQFAKSMIEVKIVGFGTDNYVVEDFVEAKIDKAWKCVVLQLEKKL